MVYKKYDINILSLITTLYLLLPIIIFFIAWINFIFSSLFILLLIISSYLIFKNCNIKLEIIDINKNNFFILLLSILLLGFWLYFSGVGGYVPQNFDYIKHNQLIHDLIYKSWPVTYDINDDPEYLVYYIAYYLPPTLIGKVLPTQIVNICFFIWAYAGLTISILWVFKIAKRFTIIVPLILILFSGLDILGYIFTKHNLPNFGEAYIDWWAQDLTFQSFTSNMYYAPQIFIPAIIATPMLLYYIIKKQNNPLVYISISCLALWSPFVLIGIIPFLIYYIFLRIKNKSLIFKKSELIIFIFSFYILTILGLYIISNDSTTTVSGLLWDFTNLNQRWNVLLLFYLLEMIFLIVLLYVFKKHLPTFAVVCISALSLFLCTLIHIGYYNDFEMRSSIPSLFVLYVYFCLLIINSKSISNKILKNTIYGICLCLVILMSCNSINDIYRSLNFTINNTTYEDTLTSNEFAYQYIGNIDNSIFKKIIINH